MKKATRLFTFIFVLSIVMSALATVFAATPVVTLPKIFADRMVLQRNEEITIYGFCDDDTSAITVSLGTQTKSTTSSGGKWKVNLEPMAAAKNLTLTVSVAGGNTVTIKDVAIGEVWICAGQSNMDFELSKIEDYESYYKSTVGTKDIRSFVVGHGGSIVPCDTAETYNNTSGHWYKYNTSTYYASAYVSAIGYIAAYEMSKYLGDVAIGLLDLNCGDTAIEAWVPAEVLSKRTEYADKLERYNEAVTEIASGKLESFGSDSDARYQYWKTVPSSFYNLEIAPYMPYTVKGCFWYQGCNNRANSEKYVNYFSDMIDVWREGFDNADMPFITFQLAPFADQDHRGVREAQFEASQKLDNVYLVSTANEGYTYSQAEIDAKSGRIHPWRKSPVAKRAAHTALNCVYGNTGMGAEYSHPIPTGFDSVGNKVVLHFSHTGTGLKIDDTTFSELTGFSVSNDGKVYIDATATINSDKTSVSITANGISEINYIRYGYNGGGNVIEYADGTSVKGVYDTLQTPIIRSTLGGNLTNSTDYPTPAFLIDASYKSAVSVSFYGKSAPKANNQIGVGDDVISVGGTFYKNYGLRINAVDYSDGKAGNTIETNGLSIPNVTTSDYVVDFATASGKTDTANHGMVASRSWATATGQKYVLHCYNASSKTKTEACGDIAVISFDMYFEAMYGDTSFGFKRYNDVGAEGWVDLATIGFKNNTIYAGSAKTLTRAFSINEWHNITMIFNFDEETYSVALDGDVFAIDLAFNVCDGKTKGLYCWHYDPANTSADTTKNVYVDNVRGYRYKKMTQAEYDADIGELTQSISGKYDNVTVRVKADDSFTASNITPIATLYCGNAVENATVAESALSASGQIDLSLTGLNKAKNYKLKVFFIDKTTLHPALKAVASED